MRIYQVANDRTGPLSSVVWFPTETEAQAMLRRLEAHELEDGEASFDGRYHLTAIDLPTSPGEMCALVNGLDRR